MMIFKTTKNLLYVFLVQSTKIKDIDNLSLSLSLCLFGYRKLFLTKRVKTRRTNKERKNYISK